MTYKELQQALAVFDLPEQVTLKGIKERHRQLIKRYHPDSGGDPENDKIRLVNNAYQLLNEYVNNYCYDFSKETFLDQHPEERLREQFYTSELWRGQDKKEK